MNASIRRLNFTGFFFIAGMFFGLLAFVGVACSSDADSEVAKPPTGDGTVAAPADESQIVIHTTSRLAGAIGSLVWNGKEFIDSTDHGRELQTAWNANAGIDPIASETFNPTEAGSRRDGAGPKSSSQLLSYHAEGNTMTSVSRPAFWLKPGEVSGKNPARNNTVLSRHQLTRRVVIGYKNLPHAIDYHVTIHLPADEHHTACVMEALTGYMPIDFDRFYTFDPTGQPCLAPIDANHGEQTRPLIFATDNGAYAMGCYAPPGDSSRQGKGPTYGRFRFDGPKVVKWNCVYRLRDEKGLGGDYEYRVFVCVGTLDEAKSTMGALAKEFAQ